MRLSAGPVQQIRSVHSRRHAGAYVALSGQRQVTGRLLYVVRIMVVYHAIVTAGRVLEKAVVCREGRVHRELWWGSQHALIVRQILAVF